MRVAYNDKMTELADLLGEMAGLAGLAMEKATQALLQADLTLAEEVISEHDRIGELSVIAEERAFALLALQAPVAGDLRSVVSGIQRLSADPRPDPTGNNGTAHRWRGEAAGDGANPFLPRFSSTKSYLCSRRAP